MPVNDLRRIRYKGYFIQSRKANHLPGEFVAWSSEQPSDEALAATGQVYFSITTTEEKAIAEIKAEIDSITSKDGNHA